jgi:acyl-CoA ligase (AMP-forming) (exosortase A-associated)
MDSLSALLYRAEQQAPDRVALVHGKNQINYRELSARVDRIASGLHHRGIERLARVAVFQEKSIGMVAMLLGIMRAGLVAVPVNPKLKPSQVAHIVSDSDASLLVTTPFKATTLAAHLPQRCALLTSLDELELADKLPPIHMLDVDPAIIFYTSGSTGQPKGVVASHRNLVAGARSVNAYLGTTAEDVTLAALPLSFDAGFSQITTALDAQACVALHEFLRATELVKTCSAHGVTLLTAVPPLWHQIADASWPAEVGNRLRIFANTGGHMPAPLLSRLRGLFPNAKPFLMYGLTEAFRSTYLDPDEVDRRPGSIGKAIPNAEVVVLRENGSTCDIDEPGELVHRGVHVCLGYWRDPARTEAKFRPWSAFPGAVIQPEVWSGDIVRRDAEGFLYFIGRRDEQIKTSGYRVSPNEVEQIVLGYEGVAEVVAFGVADPTLGERVVVVITPAGPLADLSGYLSRMMPSYMIPEVVASGVLPRNANGKLDRPAIKERYLSDQQASRFGSPTARDVRRMAG